MSERLYEFPELKKILVQAGNSFVGALSGERMFCFYWGGETLPLKFRDGFLHKRAGLDYYHIRGFIEGQPLEVELELSFDPEFCVLEHSGIIRNVGSQRSSSFKGPFSLELGMDCRQIGQIRMYHLSGGQITRRNYPPWAYDFRGTDGAIQLVNMSGLSTDTDIPCVWLTNEMEDCGVISAYEWPGRWIAYTCEQEKAAEGGKKLSLGWHQAGSNFHLEPGESALIPKSIFAFYRGDLSAGSNLLRRYFMKRMRRPLHGDRDFPPPVFYNHYYGWGNDFDEEILRREARFYAEAGCEYFVVDGGWFEKGFREGIGNWDKPDQKKLPSGLSSLSDYIHSLGMKFGLWFELEFAMKDSTWARKYPEMYMDASPYKDEIKNIPYEELALRLDRQEVREFVLDFLVSKIDEWKIDWLRLDCNNTPGAFWDANDPPDSRGWLQNQYCAGLYELLEELGRRCPDLHIETCAGGGRRMDIGMLRRASSAWMSDLAADYNCVRRFQINLNRFVPGFANSVYVTQNKATDGEIVFGTDAFPLESLYSKFAGPLGFSQKSAHFSEKGALQIKDIIAQFKALRHYLLADFYPLCEPKHHRDYDGWQFHDPITDSGIFAVFRCNSPNKSICLELKGLNTDIDYLAEQIGGDDMQEKFSFTGGHLQNFVLRKKQDCKLFHYRSSNQ